MSDLPPPVEMETRQVAAWRLPPNFANQFWNTSWRDEREKTLQQVREMLSHLTENEDWFLVQVDLEEGGYNFGNAVDAFFTDPREAMLFKLRHVL